MIKRTLTAAAVVAASVGAVADNQHGFYAGAGFSYLDSGVASGDGGSVGFTTVDFIGGYKHSDLIGAEIRVGTGASGDNTTPDPDDVSATTVDISVGHYESLYYRIESINQVAKLYALLGYTNIEIEGDDGTTTESNSDSGMSWGAGIAFILNPKSSMNFEYKTLIDTDDSEFTSFSMNFDYRF